MSRRVLKMDFSKDERLKDVLGWLRKENSNDWERQRGYYAENLHKEGATTLCFGGSRPNTMQAMASYRAGPYLGVYLWYAYRMDVIVFGAGNTIIARDCRGSSVDGSCLFDEFINKIRAIPPGGSPRFRTNIGANLLPDPKDAAAQLSAAGYAGNTDVRRLLPDDYENMDGHTTPPFSEVFDKILGVIQACRDEVGDEPLAAQLLGARDSMAYNHEARVADQSEKAIENVNIWLHKRGYTWDVETSTETLSDGSTYEKFDSQATLDAHPEVNAVDLTQTISDFVAEYSASKKYQNHFLAAQASQGYQSVLNSEFCD
ncbi:hypothetical protein N7468_000337 [Penicillium chermesinum]|uniref:Uncharacterized protein n=1 Tax=Penicillium chermesinum TaxID=63820 RepID=A0A9W9U0D0_9EURO|nr:uncharacterized protein N7468_000337 [Penicillium chermesinum]KAJ5248886.1 hypothetical protein N7468_000337 [Penicillium chermesinum]KAJ6150987.1 hypothetical protein N7470_007581 [Penicillium chermesinum]